MVVLHGVGGALDEFVVLVVAFAVLGLALHLSGRKSAREDEEATADKPVDNTTQR
jgi:hypothetical protein